MVRKSVWITLLVGLFVVYSTSIASAQQTEVIQYEIECGDEGKDFQLEVDSFAPSENQADFCEIDDPAFYNCCLANMQTVADAVESTEQLICFRTTEYSGNESSRVKTTCTGSRQNHSKAVLTACRTALALVACN